jgi:hypothetical protein
MDVNPVGIHLTPCLVCAGGCLDCGLLDLHRCRMLAVLVQDQRGNFTFGVLHEGQLRYPSL